MFSVWRGCLKLSFKIEIKSFIASHEIYLTVFQASKIVKFP